MNKVTKSQASTLLRSSDFLSGALFSASGLFFALYSQSYNMGTASRMGPGYFPSMVGWMMLLVGLILIGKAITSGPGEKVLPLDARSLLFVSASVVLFAGTAFVLGLVVAIPLLVLCSAMAARKISWRAMLLLSAFLLAICYAVFVLFLDVRLPLLPGGLS